ncbi:MAG: hypothetical protein NTW28_09695 [Candidatus Solibacter sp.]|nr:hypothetical protein [Candidatus Solibacter sp.]
MGSNPKQALGLVLFLIGWVLIAAGAAMDGSVLLIVAGIALLAGSAAVLIKAKPLEHIES